MLSPGTSEPGPEADYASPGSTSVADLSIYEAIDSKEDQQVDESGEIDYSSDDSLDDLVILPEFGAKVLRLSVEYATREVSRPSFTVKTPLLSRATKQVSIGNIVFY